MAASDSLGGQFDRRPAQIPAHHMNLIRGAIEHLGNKGIELVPGGLHITPEGGGKSRFVPNNGVWDVPLDIDSRGGYELTQEIPHEVPSLYSSFTVKHNPRTGVLVDQQLEHQLEHSDRAHLMSTAKEEFDKPLQLHDRSADHPLTHGERSVSAFGNSPRANISDSDQRNIDSVETLEMLPHIGGNPKDPAKRYGISIGSSNLDSEDLEALQGFRNAWSHVYDKNDSPHPAAPAHDVPRGGHKMSDESFCGGRQRGEVPVRIRHAEGGASYYNYHPGTGNIRPY